MAGERVEFDIWSVPLSGELCEFIGAFIGDGFTNAYGKHYFFEITGNSELDREYLFYLANMACRLFDGIKPNFYRVKNKRAIRLRFHSKFLFRLFTERFQFHKGVKSHTVCVPEEILCSGEKNVFAVVRGIFDTDGCVFFDKRKIYKKPYPRITLQVVSRPLYLNLKEILGAYFKVHSAELKRAYCIEVYGHKQLEAWMSLIGFSNQRHLNRIKDAVKPMGGIEPPTSTLPR